MKYADVQVGQEVLYSWHRTNSTNYRVGESKLATVLEVGVEHKYSVQVGGWTGHTQYRRTNDGVRIRYRLPEWGRQGLSVGDPDRPEYEETIVIAALLQPAEGDRLLKWGRAQEDRLLKWHDSQDKERAQKRIIVAFASTGYEVGIVNNGNVIIDAKDVERLLQQLGAYDS